MKSKLPYLPSLRSGLAATALLLASALPAAAQTYFRVNSEAGNTLGPILTIDHPSLNGKPKVKPLITQFWSGVYNDSPVGVQYSATLGRWQIVNEDGDNIPANAKFNVLIAKGAKTVLASPTNTTSNLTFFPIAKGNPGARLLATHVTNPVAGLPSTYSERYHGLFYVTGGPTYGNQWSLFTENSENMEAIGFHVADVTKLTNGGNPASFVFTAVGANISGYIATIDNALTNDNPNAFVFVHHVYLPASPNALNHPVAVYYTGGRWRIFNEDFSAMPNNTAFVVLVLPGTGV
jgi:hypothetical protein